MSVPKKNKNKKKADGDLQQEDVLNETDELDEQETEETQDSKDNAQNTTSAENGGDAEPKLAVSEKEVKQEFVPLSQRKAMPDVLYYKRTLKHGGVLNGVLFDIHARESITDKYMMYQLIQQGLEDNLTENIDECDLR